ncbi:DNA (cytosine-5)-methyltransferase 1 [Gemmobacter megaterium]|uniref:DNA (Cytosine-5)-methyltransferase 1 n=1 Tax=Gemmobacter megaterium TaxID=1086013 RepID=A0A1N7QBA3_9RHOB|nr:DNA cytosine methyltransferase [Gemmobacter megaterium]SIT20131.1 DNA (cytosine-5)-methyltransferase 1 [Gemmobacter megaterium]
MTAPRAYYNDNDPQACAWLRELIARGHLPDGDVDERSILDVRSSDLAGYSTCHFFAGIGGWPYALRLAGWPDCRPVWTGSPPCQPFSVAGKSLGRDDPRHLSPKFAGLVGAARPPMLFGEQVASADVFGPAAKGNRPAFEGTPPWAWLDDLSDRLEAARYAVGASDIPSAGIGAPHIRQRTFFGAVDLDWLADLHGDGCAERRCSWPAQEHDGTARDGTIGRLGDSQQPGLEGHARYGDRGHEPGRIGPAAAGPATPASTTCRMADSSGIGWFGGRPGKAGHEPGAQQRSDGFRNAGGEQPGPTDGFWSDPDWLLCRDGKWRPVESGTFPLAHGVSARVGRLRGYGNAINPHAAAEFVRAFMASVREIRA